MYEDNYKPLNFQDLPEKPKTLINLKRLSTCVVVSHQTDIGDNDKSDSDSVIRDIDSDANDWVVSVLCNACYIFLFGNWLNF